MAFDRLAGAQGEPLLLIMGLGASRFWWPDGLCEAFAGAGFAVARYDHRDAGESTRMPETTVDNPFRALLGRRGSPYTAEDMTDDAVAVLDALGWERAHLFGHSLGGAIAQRIGLRHPERTLSVTSSGSGPSDVLSGLRVLRYLRLGLFARLSRMKFPEGREGDFAASLAIWRSMASSAYPLDEESARKWIEADLDTGPRDPKAQSRQVGAKWTGPRLRELQRPMLVLHGEEDPFIRVSAAEATAKAVPGARLVTFPGVGHDFPAPLWPVIAEAVRKTALIA
jgi:pimeloyl-ACP methyl ester carboxylesterase